MKLYSIKDTNNLCPFFYYLLTYIPSFFSISVKCPQSNEASIQNEIYSFSMMKMAKGSNANECGVLSYREEDGIQNDTFYFEPLFNRIIYS